MSEPATDERIEMLLARNERLAVSLAELIRQLERIGGYSTPEQQAELRFARALLAEER